MCWLSGGGLGKARAQGAMRKRLASDAIREVRPSGLITWMTTKFPPWNYRQEIKELKLGESGCECGVQGVGVSTHNWLWLGC